MDAQRARRYPDTLVGTDSHTTMVNGLGVLGWGVGGIEAEAAMLGQPVSMLIPRVVGFKLHRRAAGRHHRHRPGADDHRDAPRARRGQQVRRVLRPRRRAPCRWPTGPPSATCRPSTARPWRSSRSTTRRSSTSSSPAAPSSRSRWSRRTPSGRACGTTRTPSRTTPSASSSTCRRSCRRWPARSARRTGSRWTDAKADVPRGAGQLRRRRREARADEASAESFPASDPPANGVRLGRRQAAPPGQRGQRRRPAGRPSRPGWSARTAPSSSWTTARSCIAAITSCTNTSNPQVMIGAGAARPERGRARPEPQAVGQDHPGARLQGRHGLLRPGRPDAVPGQARLQPGRLRLHHLHRQLRPAARGDLRRGQRGRPDRGRRCCPATATSRAGSTRTSR